MAEPGETVLEPEKKEEPKSEPTPSLIRDEIMSELDRRLATRDAAILDGMKQMLESVVNRKPEPVVTEEPTLPSAQDFFNDPASAMQKFYEIKIKPVVEAKGKAAEPDTTGLKAVVEVEKLKLRERYKDEYDKYAPFFDKVLEKVDPRVVSDPLGMDAVWRLARSYGEDALSMEEKRRQEKNLKANLDTSGGGSESKSAKVELTDAESQMAAALGVAPEDYRKYSAVEEVEVGGNRKKGAK